MSNILEVHSTIVSYADENVSNNPRLRTADWSKHQTAITAGRPLISEYLIEPSQSVVAFDGTRTLAIDGTTEVDITLVDSSKSLYRLEWVGGTLPEFRPTDSPSLAGETLEFTINNGATAKLQVTSSPAFQFLGVGTGWQVFIPGLSTNDPATVFNETNTGYWVILGTADNANSLILKRPAGQGFEGVAESVVLADDAQIQFFNYNGVQVGDKFEIVGGPINAMYRQDFEVSSLTGRRIEFISPEPLPEESAVLIGASNLVIYSDAKMFVRIETDQDTTIRFNGDSGNNVRVSPIATNSLQDMGWIEKYGPTFKLEIRNKSYVNSARVILISVG